MRKKNHNSRRFPVVALIVLVTTFIIGGCTLEQSPLEVPTPSPPTEHSTLPPATTDVGSIHVYVWNVGEALSVLIDDQETEILIDAGNDRDGANIVEKIAPYISDGELEYVIATHGHSDHIGGFEDVYEAYYVSNTIYGDTRKSEQFDEFMNAAQEENDSLLKEDEDEIIELPSGATLSILDILDGASNTNNNSVISVLQFGEYKMLVTGDAEDNKLKTLKQELTDSLLEEHNYPIDVYIVGHHGSETSSSAELLSLIKPTYAVISSEGPNRQYHNPDLSVIERLSETNTIIYATYRSGDVEITFDEHGCTLSPQDTERLTTENYRTAA